VNALLINQKEVIQLLPMNECIQVMSVVLKSQARGKAINPHRSVFWLPGEVGALAVMPAYLGDLKVFGSKVISFFPANLDTEYDSHQGAVLLFETIHGRLLAIIDAGQITAIRTAAVSGLATLLLSSEESGNLAILGSGAQAWTHLQAMLLVRRIRRVRVWSRNAENCRRFVERGTKDYGVRMEVITSAKEAVTGADLICTTTAAKEPVLLGEWISPGTHINAIGSTTPFARELDTAAAVKSRWFVDRKESILNEAGDFLFPKKEGMIDESCIVGEIGEILISRVQGRKKAEEITLFKSVGLALEDIASAFHIYKKALEKGKGVFVELGGSRHSEVK
jgi:ornithine cyclodeaminase